MLVIQLENIHIVRLQYFFQTFSTACTVIDAAIDLVLKIRGSTRRYVTLFSFCSEVVDELQLMLQPTKDISERDEAIDNILHQRREHNQQIEVPRSSTQTIVRSSRISSESVL